LNLIDKNNHLSEEHIAQYVDAMQADRMNEIPSNHVEHVENCTQCHTGIVDLYSLSEQLSTLTDSTKEAPQQNTITRRIIRIALAASVAGFAIYFYFLNSTPINSPIANTLRQEEIRATPNTLQKEIADKVPTPKSNTVKEGVKSSKPSEKKTIKKPKPDNLYAANLIPSDDFEALIGTDLRSEAIKNIKPELDTHFKPNEMITFSCNYEKNGLLYVTVLNNREDKITKPVRIDSTYSINTVSEPGLYYWTIEYKEELLHVGKFFIDI
jgi:hypothetical protein